MSSSSGRSKTTGGAARKSPRSDSREGDGDTSSNTVGSLGEGTPGWNESYLTSLLAHLQTRSEERDEKWRKEQMEREDKLRRETEERERKFFEVMEGREAKREKEAADLGQQLRHEREAREEQIRADI